MAETEEVTVTMALQDGYQFLVGSGLALGILTDHGPAGPRRVDGRQHVLVRWRLVDPTVDDPARPVLLALSDNGAQMTSGSTREFMAVCAIVQHFGRPGTPTDQAWIETLFGHIKAEWAHLDRIDDPAVLRAELEVVRMHYNTVRLHAGIGYVTPEDEHEGRGPAIRKARRDGLVAAREKRMEYHRTRQLPETR